MIHKVPNDHEWLKFSAFYNVYPIRNEIGVGAQKGSHAACPYGEIYCDDYYGRVFDRQSNAVAPKYGRAAKMRYYVPIPSLEAVEELRVPYRKVPIYETTSLRLMEQVLAELRLKNEGYEILVRGQTKLYLLPRDLDECIHFYGEPTVKEPSLLPSHLRKNFDPYFLKCMWQSQAAMLLNDIGYDLAQSATGSNPNGFWNTIPDFRNSPVFVLYALGIAQHYGLPSVGLDLTNRLDVACWFATHTLAIAPDGKAAIQLIKFGEDQAPTILFFRCPKDAVFAYEVIKPREFPVGRPDHQSAWFGHVGWGAASNQLGSYLMCGFRLKQEILNELNSDLDETLFPSPSDDLVLKHFIKMRGQEKYEGEAKRALQGIYFTKV